METNSYNEAFMQRAIALSEVAYKTGEGPPIGCVIVKNGQIIGEGHNEVFLRTNPTSHAEMVAIEDACKNLGSLELDGCELYTSLEPCPMCLAAIYWARLKAVYFAASNNDATNAGFADAQIYEELAKPPKERSILLHHVNDPKAIQVLADWKKINTAD